MLSIRSEKVALVGHSSSMIDKNKVMNDYPCVDYIIDGEFDEAVLSIAFGGKIEDIKGLTWRQFIKKDIRIITNEMGQPSELLDTFPFVTDIYRRHLNIKNYHQTAHRYPFVDLFTGRGCEWANCTFCLWPNTINKGAGYRTRSIENVITELKFIKRIMPDIKEVFIQDDTLPEWRAIELSDAILNAGLKLNWSCYSRANLDYDTLKLMKKAGCRTMHVGFESSNPLILKNIKKGISVDRMTGFTHDARKAGLFIVADFITGLPGETEQTIKDTVEWAKSLPVQRYTITLPKPYPCTPLYDYLLGNNLLEDGHPSYKGLTPQQIYEWNKWSVKQVYFNHKYFIRMLPHPVEWFRLARSAKYLLPFLKRRDNSCLEGNLEW